MSHPFLSRDSEGIWMDKWRVLEAERNFVAHSYGTNNFKPGVATQQKQQPPLVVAVGCDSSVTQTRKEGASQSPLVKEIEQARQQIQKSLKSDLGVSAPVGAGGDSGALQSRLTKVEAENKRLSGVVDELRLVVKNMENRIIALETSSPKPKVDNRHIESLQNGVPEKTEGSDSDDDDVDLFGSDEEEDEEAERVREERLKQYADKKAKKPALIAKSNIILDVKPWDDETDMKVLEQHVRKIQMDGLLWGASKLVPVGYGIRKLQISCVVEDDKVSTDDLEDEITGLEDYVQSMDIAAFNKV